MSDADHAPRPARGARDSRRPDGVAFRAEAPRHLARGHLEPSTLERVREVALALDEMGIGAGDRVAVFADNGPRWLYADLGIQALGAASVGIYPALDPAEAASAIARSGATHRLLRRPGAGGQAPRAPGRHARGRAHRSSSTSRACTRRSTPMRRSRPSTTSPPAAAPLAAERPARFGELLAARTADEVATVAFTSGTTGLGARIPAQPGRRGRAGAARRGEHRAAGSRTRATRCFRSPTRPPRLFDAYAPLVAGSTLSFSESLETVPTDLVEASPTVLVATPRLLERVRGDVELRMGHAGRFKRTLVPLGHGPARRGRGRAQRRTPRREPRRLARPPPRRPAS